MLIPPAQVDFADEDEEQVDDAEIEMLQKALRQTILVSLGAKSYAMTGRQFKSGTAMPVADHNSVIRKHGLHGHEQPSGCNYAWMLVSSLSL